MYSNDQNSKVTTSFHLPLLFCALPFAFLGFGLPIFSKRLGASALEIGGLFSVFTAMTIILRPVIGWAIDRFGRKYYFVIALLFYSLTMVAFSLASDLTGLYLARILQGIGASFLWISVNTMVADLAGPGERGRGYGRIDEIVARGSLIGIFAGFALVASLPEGVAWQTAFMGYAIMAAMGAIMAWRNVPETKPDVREAAPQKTTLTRSAVILLIVVFTMSASEAMLGPIFLIFLQDKVTTNITHLAWAFLPAGLVAAFLSSRLGALSDSHSRFKMIALGLAGAGLVSLALPETCTIPLLAVLFTCSAVLWAIARPAVMAVFADFAGIGRRGRSFGLFTLVGNLGLLCGPIIGGGLYDTVTPALPFYLNGCVLILCSVCARIFLRNLSLKTIPHQKETTLA
jgi:MFS family permease